MTSPVQVSIILPQCSVLSAAGGEERGDMQELSGDMMTAGASWGVTGDILPSSRWGAATQPQPVTGLLAPATFIKKCYVHNY